MNPTEHTPKTPSPRRRFFAVLANALGARGTRISTAGLAVLTAGLIFSTGVASATRAAHAFEKSLGSPGSAAGQLALRAVGTGVAGSGVAVNEKEGFVYVADTENHRVDEFDPSKPPAERFVRAFGWGVGVPGGLGLETCGPGTLSLECKAGASGPNPGEFVAPAFIAVDNSGGESEGDVYVGDTGDNKVSKFTSEGALVGSWGVGGQLSQSTASGEGDLSFGSGTGDLSAATGTGELTEHSPVVTGVVKTSATGAFEVGQEVSGIGIPGATTILGFPAPGELELSAEVEEGFTGVEELHAGSKTVKSVLTSPGSEFAVGQEVSGPGVPAGATIAAVLSPTELELSQPAEKAEIPAALTGTSKRITEVTTASGFFTPGQEISGTGIPAGTTVTGTPEEGVIEVSKLPEAAGVGVPLTAHRSFAPLAGITVSPTGTLDVLNTAQKMFQFEQAGASSAPEFTVSYGEEYPAAPRGLAVDVPSGGFFEVAYDPDSNEDNPLKFNPEGHPVVALNAAADALATDASDLFVAEPGLVKSFPLAGLSEATPPGESFGSGTLVDSAGVAVDASHEDTVFVSDAATNKVDVFAPEPAAAPAVLDESVSEVTDDSAVFAGKLDPRSLAGEEATTYEFRYGPCASAATCASAPFPDATAAGSLAASFEVESVTVAEPVKGLVAGTTYHFELVARNAHGVVDGQERVFSTRGTGGFVLPDGRQWQMVSPVDKEGARIEPIGGPEDGPDGAVTQAALMVMRSRMWRALRRNLIRRGMTILCRSSRLVVRRVGVAGI